MENSMRLEFLGGRVLTIFYIFCMHGLEFTSN